MKNCVNQHFYAFNDLYLFNIQILITQKKLLTNKRKTNDFC